MVQAARSGVQNIAEGSQASGTSKKMELKLTNVARASLEELRLDYEDFLRQRGLPQLEPEHPALKRFRERRCAKLGEVRQWVKEGKAKAMDEHGLSRTGTDKMPSVQAAPGSVPVRVSPCQSTKSPTPAHLGPCPQSVLSTNPQVPHPCACTRPCQSVPVHRVHKVHPTFQTPLPRNPGRQCRPFPPEPGLPSPGPPACRPGGKLSSGGRLHRAAVPRPITAAQLQKITYPTRPAADRHKAEPEYTAPGPPPRGRRPERPARPRP
jgi:hypothetical protein